MSLLKLNQQHTSKPSLLDFEEPVRTTKPKQNDSQQLLTEQALSTREILQFALFCVFFILATSMQAGIGESQATNRALRRALREPTEEALRENARYVDFKAINIEQTYWDWLRQFTRGLYNEEYY